MDWHPDQPRHRLKIPEESKGHPMGFTIILSKIPLQSKEGSVRSHRIFVF